LSRALRGWRAADRPARRRTRRTRGVACGGVGRARLHVDGPRRCRRRGCACAARRRPGSSSLSAGPGVSARPARHASGRRRMIEPVGAEAIETLAALHARAFDQPWSAAEIGKLLGNAAVFAMISRGRDPQGFVMAWTAAGDAELLTVAVVPEARRKGVGASLVTAAGVAALARGAATMHLEVAEDNAPARALYAKLGYEQAGRRRGYYAAGRADAVDAIVMRRTLPRPIV